MKYEELEKARREFMEGKRTAESYWSAFRCYWSQFKARCRSCYWLNWDFVTDDYVCGPWFCGLHGGTRVDPDGEQRDLDHRGGCGYIETHELRQLRLPI